MIRKYILVWLLVCFAIGQSDWPQWRGLESKAIARGNLKFIDKKPYSFKLLWKQKLGSGYSSVSILNTFVVSMYSDGKFDYVICLHEKTGKKLWQHTIDDTYIGHDGSHNGPISTPLIVGNKVFALSAKGVFIALSLSDGKVIWRKDLLKNYNAKKPFYGFGTSPISYKNLVIIQVGQEKKTITAFHQATGKIIWSKGTDAVHYQCPILFKNKLLSVGDKELYCFDPENGKELWNYHHNGGAWGGTPVIVNLNPARIFLQHKNAESVLLEISDNLKNPVTQIWKTRNIKKTYSPAIFNQDKIYGYSGRFFSCVDAKTGKKIWKSRQPGDGFFIIVDDFFVLITKKGTLHLAIDNDNYTSICQEKIFDDLVWSPPSFANGKVYVRSLGEIACLKIVAEKSKFIKKKKYDALISSNFSNFITKLSITKNKKKEIDIFMKQQKQFPIIETNSIHFVYRGKAEDIGLESDIFGFRKDIPMKQIPNSNFFYYSSKLEPNARIQYRFIKDFGEAFVDPRNTETNITYFGNFSIASMPKWKEAKHLKVNKTPSKLKIIKFKSSRYDDVRNLQIYLPDSFNKNKEYPVIYIHDGKNALKKGKWHNSIDNTITNKKAIIVFIPLKNQREFSSSRQKYLDLFTKEWIPYIDKEYNISKQEKYNIGSGIAGYISLYCTMHYPSIFSGAASQSSFLLKKEEEEFKKLVVTLPKHLKFYISWGKYDERSPLEGWSVVEGNSQLAKTILENGFQLSGGEFPVGGSWVNWRNTNAKILKYLLK